MTLDLEALRLALYRSLAATGRAPDGATLAAVLREPEDRAPRATWPL